jgi:hypothetical protein
MAQKFFPLPRTGDILWCNFPLKEDELKVGPKPRPALVAAVSSSTGDVEVIFGTSKKTDHLYEGEFLINISDPEAAVSGLGLTTKFDTTRRYKLPFDSDWFAQAPRQVNSPLPKMGSLHVNYYKALLEAVAAGQKPEKK